MKKIILGGLILSSLFVGITNAFIMPINEETTFGDGTITCDENFNCITENANGDTFNGISPSFLTKRNWFVFFNSGLISEVYGFNTLKTYYVQQRPILICRTDYNSAINYTQTVTDYLSGCQNNLSTGNAILWSEEDLGGKITSYTINTIGSNNGHGAVICANYNEDIKSACFNVRDNLGSNYDFGISDTIFNWDNFVGFGLAESSPRAGGGPDTEGGPISCINIKSQIMLYGANYNTGLCYTNGIEFSGNQIINTGKLSIFDVYPTYQDYKEALNLYNTYCSPTSPSTPEYCQQVMQGHQPEYTRQFVNSIKNMDSNMIFTVTTQKLYQYCHLQLNFTEEEKRTECKDTVENYYATGITEESDANGNPFEGISDRVDNNIQIAVPTTGTVFDEFLDGDTRVVGITDRYENFKEMYHKIMGLFKYRNTQQGIIPGYITAMLMLILLLAIFKK